MIDVGKLPGDFRDYIDVESCLKRVAGNQAILIRLLKSFLDNGTVEQLMTQISRGDIDGAAMTAHGIKGISGNLSLTGLYNNVVELESQLKQGKAEGALMDEFLATSEKTRKYLLQLIESSDGGRN